MFAVIFFSWRPCKLWMQKKWLRGMWRSRAHGTFIQMMWKYAEGFHIFTQDVRNMGIVTTFEHQTQWICTAQESWACIMTVFLEVLDFKQFHQNWWSRWKPPFMPTEVEEVSASWLASPLPLFPAPNTVPEIALWKAFKWESAASA